MATPTSCACGIDVHAHVVPERFPAYVGNRLPGDWPSTAPAHDACHRRVMISGKVYRTVSEPCWSPTRRLADLPAMGLAMQAISPMPELLSTWMEPAAAQQLLRWLNEQIAAMAAESGGRLIGLGAVPLQDLDLAIAELRHAVETLGFAGVEIGSNVGGTAIGDARFDPFFEACEALGAAVFVHALKPAGMDRLVGPAPLQQVLAYPTDVGLAAASVVTGGLLQRHPRLRMAFSHGGGTFASLLPRLQQGWQVFPALKESIAESPAEQARRLWYDTLVFDAPTLQHLVGQFGASQLMVGTDYPFNFHDRTPVERIEAAGFDADTVARLVHRNAERFLGLEQRTDDMASPWIAALRSVALNVPDLQAAEDFYTRVWQLDVVAREDGAIWLRGTGADHHLLALHAGDGPAAVRHVTLRARSAEALDTVADAAVQAGGSIVAAPAPLAGPGGGRGLTVRDADGRVFQVVFGDRLHEDAREAKDCPLRLAHVVLNSRDIARAQAFLERAFGFRLADRTRIMAFMNCNADHHSIALGDTDNDALNHIAFLMPGLDAVMRGGGRMKDAGHDIEWGPGRHGPGDNAFNYFIDPFGVVIEYTAEVEQIDDSYRAGTPDDWKWPTGRVDQWGIGRPPSERLKAAQRQVFFAPVD